MRKPKKINIGKCEFCGKLIKYNVTEEQKEKILQQHKQYNIPLRHDDCHDLWREILRLVEKDCD